MARAALVFDALAFAIFALQRNDYLAFWQLAGSWSDVFRFDAIGAAIAYAVYLAGTSFVLITLYRALRPVEAIGLIAHPVLFQSAADARRRLAHGGDRELGPAGRRFGVSSRRFSLGAR